MYVFHKIYIGTYSYQQLSDRILPRLIILPFPYIANGLRLPTFLHLQVPG